MSLRPVIWWILIISILIAAFFVIKAVPISILAILLLAPLASVVVDEISINYETIGRKSFLSGMFLIALFAALITLFCADKIECTLCNAIIKGEVVQKEVTEEYENGDIGERTKSFFIPSTEAGKSVASIIEALLWVVMIGSPLTVLKMLSSITKSNSNGESAYN